VIVPVSGAVALVPNLGLDRVAQLEFDDPSGRARENPRGAAYGDQPGSGPRTLAASSDPANPHVYLSHEFASSLSVLTLTRDGTLQHRSTISTLPAGFRGENTGAHVAVHPNGRFVYASNRGHDSIAVFALSDDGSTLSPLQQAPSRGAWPRHFALDRLGRFLVAANQQSGSVAAFRIAADGRLEASGDVLHGLKEPTTVAVIAR
jgi:6-phosphogluconolactonase